MSSDHFSIDSYHFNVRQGDGAIHILSKESPTGSPEVVGSTLIDAGTGSNGNGSDNIECMEYFIRQGYQEHYEKTIEEPHYIKFNSIVISHWDSDHYQGIMKLIERDTQSNWNKYEEIVRKTFRDYDPTKDKISPEEITIARDFLEDSLDELTDKQLWDGAVQIMRSIPEFLDKYNIGFIGLPASSRRTALYAPDFRIKPPKPEDWNDTLSGFLVENLDLAKKTFKSSRLRKTPVAHRPFSRAPIFAENSSKPNTLDICCSFTIKIPRRADPKIHYWYKGVCDLYYKSEDMIGRDILTNERCSTACSDITNRWKLIEDHQKEFPANTFPVGIYCLGVHRAAIGYPMDKKIDKQPKPKLFQLTSDSAAVPVNSDSELSDAGADPGKFVVFMVDKMNEKNNTQSIVTIVLWKDKKEVSHYFAGDADYLKELFALEWLLKDPTPTPAEFRLPNMKLSHHGAASSTPTPLVTRCFPENVIISAGEHANHQHPRPEVVFFFYTWLLQQERAGGAKGEYPFYAMQYPFYADDNWHDQSAYRHIALYNASTTTPKTIPKKVPNFPSLLPNPKTPERTFLERLHGLYATINTQRASRKPDPAPPLRKIQDQFKNWCEVTLKKKKDDYDIKTDKELYNMGTWIAYQVQSMWEEVSGMFAGKARRQPVYIVIRSSSPADHEVQILYDSDPSAIPTISLGRGRDRDLSGIDWADEKEVDPPTSKAVPSTAKLDPTKEIELIKWPTATFSPVILAAMLPTKPLIALATADPETMSNTTDKMSSNKADLEPSPMPVTILRDMPGDGNGETPYTITAEDAVTNPPLYMILSLLQQKQITLERKPGPKESAKLLQTDEWYAWFQASLSTTTLVAQTGADDQISAFALTMDCSSHFPEANVTQLTFSTDCFTKSCIKKDPPSNLPLGVLENTGTMGFGLDIGKAGNWSLKTNLSAVMNYVGLNAASNTILNFLGSQVALTLDGTPEATDGARNAIWFTPATAYTTLTRLQWNIDDLQLVQKKLEFLKGAFTLSKVNLITRRKCTYRTGPSGDTIVITEPKVILAVKMNIVQKEFLATMEFEKNNIQLQITNDNPDVLKEIVDWLQSSISQDIPVLGWLQDALNLLKHFFFRRISINVDKNMKIKSFHLAMEVALTLGASDANPPPFLLTYSSTRGKGGNSLMGQLWLSPQNGDSNLDLLPEYEAVTSLKPITVSSMAYLDLAKLSPDSTIKPPNGVPTQVQEAFVAISSSDIRIGGQITCKSPDAGHVPTIALNVVTLDATYTFKGEEKGLQLSLGVDVSITPPPAANDPVPLRIQGSLGYDKGDWTLVAKTTPVYAGALYQFFDPDAQDGTLSLLDKLELGGLDLEYKYLDGVGSEFTFSGSLYLGDLALALKYEYKKDGWSFTADLSSKTESSTLNSVIGSITGDDQVLPDFVGDIGIGGKDKSALKLVCTKTGSKKSTKSTESASAEETSSGEADFLFFMVSINIEVNIDDVQIPLKGTFLQYREVSWSKDVAPKRLLKFAVTKLPDLSIAAVGNLTQPFDEMFYQWLSSDKPGQEKIVVPGLTQTQVDSINGALTNLAGGADELVFKVQNKKPGAGGTGSTAVIAPGHHFVLVLKLQGKREVILDYVFSAPKPTPKSSNSGEGARALVEVSSEDEKGSGDDASLVPFKKQAGAITISNIGFTYKGNTLSILLDAAFVLGPLSFKLVGFKLKLTFKKGFSLAKLPDLGFGLDGLSVSFEKPPLTIGGMFIVIKNPTIDGYLGGIVLGFVPYLFKAAGFYGTVTTKDSNSKYTSVFVFAKLDGPLIELGYAEISGITGGFGYNMSMRFPTAENVTSFPLVDNGAFGNDLAKSFTTLLALDGDGNPTPDAWFSVKQDSFWVAAGLKVTALEILSVDAVVVVEWNPEVKLGIFGVAVADFPKGGPSNIKCHIELGISCVVDLGQGVMKLEAQLSPNSHLFDPNCRLTGGFALCYWFDGKHADKKLIGDWVFTVGGYHRAYTKPAHYPNPPRLGISWDLAGAIKITGEAYFAITPKCCMAGGRLVATLVLGPLRAWFEAFADFLINYRPFYFMADGGITVGVSCKVDLLIVSFTVSVEIGATLHLEGPPLCGRVHVNFYIVAFDINFGPQPKGPDTLDFQHFYMLVRQVEALDDVSRTPDGYDLVDKDAYIFSCVSGLLTDAEKSNTQPKDQWVVKGGIFGFQLKSRVAISATYQPITEVVEEDEPPKGRPIRSENAVYARPMKTTAAEALASELDVRIKRRKEEMGMRALMAEEEEEKPNSWYTTPLYLAVPAAIWGWYDPSTDARASGNNAEDLLKADDSVVEQMMGLEYGSPAPFLPAKELILPPFSAKDSMEASVNPKGDEPSFKKIDDANGNWAPNDKEKEEDRWKEIPRLWEDKANDQGQVVDTMIRVMGWDKNEFTGFGTPKLLLDPKRFLDLYLAAPMITIA